MGGSSTWPPPPSRAPNHGALEGRALLSVISVFTFALVPPGPALFSVLNSLSALKPSHMNAPCSESPVGHLVNDYA